MSFLRSKVVLPAWASGELYRKSLSFEFRSIYQGLLGVVTNGVLVSGSIRKAMGDQPNILVAAVRAILTRNHITGIHHVLVLDEAKAVHQLDFLDRARPMTGKMVLDFLLRDWMGKVSCQLGPVCLSSGEQPWPPECASQKSVSHEQENDYDRIKVIACSILFRGRFPRYSLVADTVSGGCAITGFFFESFVW